MKKVVWRGPQTAIELTELLGDIEWKLAPGGTEAIIYLPDDFYKVYPGETVVVSDDGDVTVEEE